MNNALLAPGGSSKVLWHTLVSTMGAVHVWSCDEVMRAATVKMQQKYCESSRTDVFSRPPQVGTATQPSFLLSVKLEVKSHRSETAARVPAYVFLALQLPNRGAVSDICGLVGGVEGGLGAVKAG